MDNTQVATYEEIKSIDPEKTLILDTRPWIFQKFVGQIDEPYKTLSFFGLFQKRWMWGTWTLKEDFSEQFEGKIDENEDFEKIFSLARLAYQLAWHRLL